MIETINGKAYLKVGDKVYELGGGGTGTVSWNDLTDKPFGDESVTIEWDGNTEGHIAIDVYGAVTYVKVSDLTPETDELIGGTIVSSDSQDKKTITADNIEDERPDYAGVTVGVGEQPYIMVNHETGTHIAGDIVLPEKGTYFMMVNGIYPIYLTYGSLKKLDPKYLPDDIGGGGLPEVVLTTTVDTGVMFTAEENAALSAAAATGKPVIVKCTIMDTTDIVMTMNNFSGLGFITIYANYNFAIMLTEDGVWSALVEEINSSRKVVTIDETVSQMILGTLIQGDEGTTHYNFDGVAALLSPILAECDTDQPIVISLSYGGVSLEMQSINKGYIGEVLSLVAFTGALYYENVLIQCGVTLVVNNSYGCVSILKQTEPVSLPKVTAEDNGKFLQVVDGAIALVALQDVSKEGA